MMIPLEKIEVDVIVWSVKPESLYPFFRRISTCQKMKVPSKKEYDINI